MICVLSFQYSLIIGHLYPSSSQRFRLSKMNLASTSSCMILALHPRYLVLKSNVITGIIHYICYNASIYLTYWNGLTSQTSILLAYHLITLSHFPPPWHPRYQRRLQKCRMFFISIPLMHLNYLAIITHSNIFYIIGVLAHSCPLYQ